MNENQAKKKKSLLYSKTALFFFLIAVLFLAKGTLGVFLKERESAKNAEEASKELATLVARQKSLEEKNIFLNTQEGVEAEIREKFQVAKEGEGVIVIVDKETNSENEEANKGFFGKTWSKIKGFFGD